MDSFGRNRRSKYKWFTVGFVLTTIIMIHTISPAPSEVAFEHSSVQNSRLSNEMFTMERNVLLGTFQYCYNKYVLKKSNSTKEILLNFERGARKCDQMYNALKLDIRPVSNTNETKWIIYPSVYETLTKITLGIGNDTDAEVELKKMLPNIEFYGSDLFYDNNVLYRRIGKYFPENNHYRSLRVYSDGIHRESLTKKHDFIHFLTKIVKKKRIDILWVDVEGGEFEIMEYIASNKELKQNGISLCQINMEVHINILNNIKDEKLLFATFIRKIIANGEYIIAKPYFVDIAEYIRVFLINVTSPECRRLYIEKKTFQTE